MEAFIKNMEIEFNELHDSLKDLKTENQHLKEEKMLLKNDIEKRKNFHRRYVNDVTATEAIRIQDFNKEKKEFSEERKQMSKVNRQLVKDLEFYKKAHEELAKRELSVVEAGNSSQSNSNDGKQATSTSESQTVSNRPPSRQIKQKSSTVVAKINLSLFEENKQLQKKLSDMSSKNSLLNKKVKQLENFRSKIENKKSKFCRDSEELERLVDFSKKKEQRRVYTRSARDVGKFGEKQKLNLI